MATGESRENWDGKAFCPACCGGLAPKTKSGSKRMKVCDVREEEAAKEVDYEKLAAMIREVGEKVTNAVLAEREECQRKIEEFIEKNQNNDEKRQKALCVLEDIATICMKNDLTDVLDEVLRLAQALEKPVKTMTPCKLGRHIVAEEESWHEFTSIQELASMVPTDTDISIERTCLPTRKSHRGVAFDPHRRILLATSLEKNNGGDVMIVRLSDDGRTGKTTIERGLIPFSISMGLVYDNEKYVYALGDGPNRRFGRIDLDTMEFEELAEGEQATESSYGGYTASQVLKMLLFYQDRMAISHPWNNGAAIELVSNSFFHVVSIDDGAVIKTFPFKFNADGKKLLGIRMPGGNFLLLAFDFFQAHPLE